MVFSGLYSASEFTVSSLQLYKLQAKGSQKGNTQVKLIQFLFSCRSIQKSLSLLFSCAIFGQHTEDVSHYILPHSGSVTPLQHWQFSSPCSLGVFSGKKQILLFGNTCSHFISFSFCHILVMSSFKNCLENGNRLVIASKKTNKNQNKLRIASVKEVFPSCLLLWVFIPYPWEAVRRLPLTLHQNPRDFYGRCIWSSFGDVYDAEKKEVQEIVTLKTLATVSSPSWAHTQLPSGPLFA